MRRLAFRACPLALTMTLALMSAPALGQGGTTTSAGDQQYVDPLASNTPKPHHRHHAAAAPRKAATSSGSHTLSQTPPSAFANGTGATSTTSSSADPAQTLPFTGLDVWACLAVGIGLVASGLGLRLMARRA